MDKATKINPFTYCCNNQEITIASYFSNSVTLKEIMKQYLLEQYKNELMEAGERIIE